MPKTAEDIIEESRNTRMRIAAQRQGRGIGAPMGGNRLEARAMAAIRKIEQADETGRRMASIRANRPNFLTERPATGRYAPEAQERRRAFAQYIRTGQIQASLRTANDAGGGVFVPLEVSQTIRENLVLVSQVRAVATVATASTDTVRVPKRTAASTAAWVGENDQSGATGPSYGGADVTINDARCYVDLSNNLLADSAIDVEAWLTRELGKEMGRLEGAAFINGTGTKQPQGLLQSPDIKYYPSGSSTAITADNIVNLPFQLPAMYAQKGAWLMNRTTMGVIRGFKDNYGRYIFDANLDKNGLPTIQGQPVIDCPDMPNVGSGASPVIFGDVESAYVIFDRTQLPIIRDIITQAGLNNTRFHYFHRVGGAVTLGEALVKLQVSTS